MDIEQQINRVDRQRSLMLGIGCGVIGAIAAIAATVLLIAYAKRP
jgi:hypothetical protein